MIAAPTSTSFLRRSHTDGDDPRSVPLQRITEGEDHGRGQVGEEFIKHEFDEAIAIQQCIVDAESSLSTAHPSAAAKRAIKSSLAADEKYLRQLKQLGKQHGATGEIEDVAGGLKELMDSTLEKATSEGNDSDFYEAHAVLLNLKRKQWDSAGGMLAIARDQKDTALRDAAKSFQAGQKETSTALTKELAAYAVQIAGAAA